ncbi:hypothetical protein [uncultured Pseudomonas sp.]|uniref:hypothetical protein n=1 Tax=uncultured Pseudomonas sp. TaxID=114707 RepID=UPI00261058FE|nr:hypothetical protein [uncultured Pseudomonas sp.]
MLTEPQLLRAIYSLWDFQQALSALTFLLEDCDFDKNYSKIELRRFRCYETTTIVSMARPLEQSRGGSTLNLGVVGIKQSKEEKRLVEKILTLRRKVFAHSDENEMHFRSSTFRVFDGEINFPHIQFKESLHLEKSELLELEKLLRKLTSDLAEFIFHFAQKNPDAIEKYKIPVHLQAKSSKA